MVILSKYVSLNAIVTAVIFFKATCARWLARELQNTLHFEDGLIARELTLYTLK